MPIRFSSQSFTSGVHVHSSKREPRPNSYMCGQFPFLEPHAQNPQILPPPELYPHGTSWKLSNIQYSVVCDSKSLQEALLGRVAWSLGQRHAIPNNHYSTLSNDDIQAVHLQDNEAGGRLRRRDNHLLFPDYESGLATMDCVAHLLWCVQKFLDSATEVRHGGSWKLAVGFH